MSQSSARPMGVYDELLTAAGFRSTCITCHAMPGAKPYCWAALVGVLPSMSYVVKPSRPSEKLHSKAGVDSVSPDK